MCTLVFRNEVEMAYMCSDHERSELLNKGEEVMEGRHKFWSTEVVLKYSSSGSRVSSPGVEFELFSINWVSA